MNDVVLLLSLPGRNMHPRRGLSFLEVSIVILIVGLLVAVGTPRFANSLQHQNARNAATQIAEYIGYVRNIAVNEGRTTTISVSEQLDRFSSPEVDFPGRPGTALSLDVKTAFDPSLELSASFDSQTTLAFDFEGGASAGGASLSAGVITIASPTCSYQVLIDPAGAASVVPVRPGTQPDGGGDEQDVDALEESQGGLQPQSIGGSMQVQL